VIPLQLLCDEWRAARIRRMGMLNLPDWVVRVAVASEPARKHVGSLWGPERRSVILFALAMTHRRLRESIRQEVLPHGLQNNPPACRMVPDDKQD
jgi:hypothetical protein